MLRNNVQTGQEPDRAHACHGMLLRLAGRAPDALITRSRGWLAHGEVGHVARAVAFWAVSQDALLDERDAELLSDVLTEAGEDPSELGRLAEQEYDPYPRYGLGPRIPPEMAGGTGEGPDPLAPANSVVDQAAVDAVEAEPEAVGLWRAWRCPASEALWPPPKRVFVIETSGSDEPGLAARAAERLAAAGEADPQVEVYRSGYQLPAYAGLARSCGELMWAAAPASPIGVASVFDEVDADTGPRFQPDHPVLDRDEAVKVAEYLYGADQLLVTLGRMDDVLDGSQISRVPLSFRTDGRWVWNEASAYYAGRYLLAPAAGLLEHLRSNGYSPPAAADGVALYRALKVLQESADNDVGWMFGAGFGEPAHVDASGT